MTHPAVLVVGSSGGIGTSIVKKLHETGFEVIGMDKKEPNAQAPLKHFVNVDLVDEDLVLDACKIIKRKVKKLWGLVYSAGVYNPKFSLKDYDVNSWKQVQAINVTGAFIIIHELSSIMAPNGRIVTIISGAAHIGSRDVAYSASKAALLGLTKSIALNLSERDILVNAICPGPIVTQMSQQMPMDRVKQYKDKILLHRFGEPNEVAVGVAFLMAPENTFMTGATLDINGGLYLR